MPVGLLFVPYHPSNNNPCYDIDLWYAPKKLSVKCSAPLVTILNIHIFFILIQGTRKKAHRAFMSTNVPP